jgi:hypothetical protein
MESSTERVSFLVTGRLLIRINIVQFIRTAKSKPFLQAPPPPEDAALLQPLYPVAAVPGFVIILGTDTIP